jgi:hypothetical protein
MAGPSVDRVVADRYLLRAQLGRGGMGVVWRAHDTVLGRAVAVKEVGFPPILPEAERRAAEARVRGARAAARLNHPGAVTIYDVVHDQGHTFVVMELVQAPTLADLIQAEGPLPPERVAEIGGQLARRVRKCVHAARRYPWSRPPSRSRRCTWAGWSSAIVPARGDRAARVSYDGWWTGGMAEELGDPMDGGP